MTDYRGAWFREGVDAFLEDTAIPLRLRIEPERVASWDFTDRMPGA